MLVAEDSEVSLEYLVALLGVDDGIDVVGTAADGLEAVAQAEALRPDVILMDIHMPRVNGLEATRRIMQSRPTPIVLVSAGFRSQEALLSFEALKAGALTVLDKPPGIDHPGQAAAARDLVTTLKLMADIAVVRRTPARPVRAPSAANTAREPGRRVRLVAVGASTGGPAAVAEVLGLGGAQTPPVLVVQHMTPGFISGFVEWLGGQTPMEVKLAEAGEPVRRGTVYVAPDGHELGIRTDGCLRLDACGRGGGRQATVGHLFDSVARAYGADALAILLTGMGRDGALELARLRGLGARTVAQDQESSVVFGMPGEAVRLGAAVDVLAPPEIARLIHSLADPIARK